VTAVACGLSLALGEIEGGLQRGSPLSQTFGTLSEGINSAFQVQSVRVIPCSLNLSVRLDGGWSRKLGSCGGAVNNREGLSDDSEALTVNAEDERRDTMNCLRHDRNAHFVRKARKRAFVEHFLHILQAEEDLHGKVAFGPQFGCQRRRRASVKCILQMSRDG
jgi:hypothetical protein